MKGRKQKIEAKSATCQQRDRAESERHVGGQTYLRITENNITNAENLTYGMLEQILSPTNLNNAYRKVKKNHGRGGIDKMEVEALGPYLSLHKEELIASIMKGTYRPNPVRRVEIPKDDKKMRMLGIPTVVDRVIQQAITQVLTPIYERQFSNSSFGFRPNRNAHQALNQCKDYIGKGYRYAVDMDLEKFFDTVNQSKLIEVLSRSIKDGRVISLIHKFLKAGVVVRNKFEETNVGVPQGGPLSPLLSNIMLNELDKELEKRAHRFVRYADDMVIMCKSKRSADRTLRNIVSYIENKLFLKINKEKTVSAYISKIKFLGYSFYDNGRGGYLRVHPKSRTKMKERIKSLTSRSNGWGDAKRKEALRQYVTGWINYFKLADMNKLLPKLDEWYRRRLRMVIWKQWKRSKTRFYNLLKLGVSKQTAWEHANTRKGYWRIALSPVLSTTITNDRLRKAGYIFFTDHYRQIRA